MLPLLGYAVWRGVQDSHLHSVSAYPFSGRAPILAGKRPAWRKVKGLHLRWYTQASG